MKTCLNIMFCRILLSSHSFSILHLIFFASSKSGTNKVFTLFTVSSFSLHILSPITIIPFKFPLLYKQLLTMSQMISLFVVVQTRVGKEFPDTRQNVKEIEFIRGKRRCQNSGWTSQQSGRVQPEHVLQISFYSQKTKEWSEVKISFNDWSRHIYLPSIGWEWDSPDAFPYLGQVPLPRWE